MTRCIAILTLALTATLLADQSPAEEFWPVHFEVVVDTIGSGGTFTLSDNQSGFSPVEADYTLLLDMGFSPEEADYILLLGFDAFGVIFLDGHVEEFEMGDHRY